jgi:hypothetical protein
LAVEITETSLMPSALEKEKLFRSLWYNFLIKEYVERVNAGRNDKKRSNNK